MPLVIPSGLQPSDPLATIFNSQEKAYQDDKDSRKSCDLKETDKLFVWYDENSERVKIATHAKFDNGFNDLPINNLPPNCQQILQLNGETY